MSNRQSPVDVFVISSSRESSLAFMVASNFEYFGLRATTAEMISQNKARTISSAVRDAIAEAVAVVAVIGPDSIDNPNVMYELGAAFALNKMCYLIGNGIEHRKLPVALAGFRMFKIDQIDQLAKSIRDSVADLTSDEIEILGRLYRDYGVATDKLLSTPSVLDRITSDFNSETNRSLSAELILQHMIRLRKQRKLASLRKNRSND